MFDRNLLIATGLALAAGATFAQGTYREDERNVQQEQRIQQGETNGTLSPYEASHLQRQQRLVRGAERHAAADGKITPREREHIRHLQEHSSADIARDKRDNNGN